MKVLHLTTHLNPGGITTYLLRLVRPLKERGIEMLIASSGGSSMPLFEDKGVRVRQFPICTKSELNPRIYFSIPGILKWIDEERIGILHAHTRVTQVLAFWIQKFRKIPVVTTCHGFFRQRLGRRLFPAWGDAVIAISEGVAEFLTADFNVPGEKIHLIQNGVDIEELEKAYFSHDPGQLKASLGFNREDFVIGNVARLVRDKGHEFLIHSMKELVREFPELRLVIAGDGKYRGRLEQLTDVLGLRKNVFFTGHLRDVTKVLRMIDIFVFPPTWREGFGLSIIEAMACRKAVIATDIWCLYHLIHDGVTGLLIKPSRIDMLTNSIRDLLKSPGLREKLAEQGRQMVERSYTIERMAEQMTGLYHSAVSGAAAPKSAAVSSQDLPAGGKLGGKP